MHLQQSTGRRPRYLGLRVKSNRRSDSEIQDGCGSLSLASGSIDFSHQKNSKAACSAE